MAPKLGTNSRCQMRALLHTPTLILVSCCFRKGKKIPAPDEIRTGSVSVARLRWRSRSHTTSTDHHPHISLSNRGSTWTLGIPATFRKLRTFEGKVSIPIQSKSNEWIYVTIRVRNTSSSSCACHAALCGRSSTCV